ncbi:MAG TPA: hypothetical protein VND64_15470 [Pirellulales bacterium]|nr:hypothetical protein [Pirellulales bacterium]
MKYRFALTAVAWIFFFVATDPLPAGDAWRYVMPEPGAEHEHPPLRAIPLASEKPDDLKELAEYRGGERRYAQIRFGSPGSKRVAIVLDRVSPGEVDLYVDANRSRSIEPKERVAGEDRVWRVPLDVEIVEGEIVRTVRRQVIFRLGTTGRTLSYAAAGFLEGEVEIGGRKVAVRRMDGDGNGFFTDAQDRFWLDADCDGRWEAASEQFLHAPILALDGTRYAVRSDELGTLLALDLLEGTGTIKLAVQQPTPEGKPSQAGVAGRVVELAVTLVGRDGSAVGLRGAQAEVVVPRGEYRVSALTVALDDPAGGPRWNFVFSDGGTPSDHHWYNLEKDLVLPLDPLAGLVLTACGAETAATCKPGEQISVQPRLVTGDGLLINACFRGTHDSGRGSEGSGARLALVAGNGSEVSAWQSGFA